MDLLFVELNYKPALFHIGANCPDCGVFVVNQRRREHMAGKHLNQVLMDNFVTDEKSCTICGKKGDDKRAIARHAGLGCNMLAQVCSPEQLAFCTVR